MIRFISHSFSVVRSAFLAPVSLSRGVSRNLQQHTANKVEKAWQRISEGEKKALFDRGKSLVFGEKKYSEMTRKEQRLVNFYQDRIRREGMVALLNPARLNQELAEIEEEKAWQHMSEEERKALFNRGKSLVFGEKKYSEMTRKEQRLVNFYQDKKLEEEGVFLANLDPKLAEVETEKAWQRAWQRMSEEEKEALTDRATELMCEEKNYFDMTLGERKIFDFYQAKMRQRDAETFPDLDWELAELEEEKPCR